MLKFFQARLQAHELRTSRCSSWILKRQRSKISNCQHPLDHRESKEFQKNITSASLIMLKPLTVWITRNCGKFLRRWEYQATLPASCKTCVQVKKQQLEMDMGQRTGSKVRKEYVKAVYCHPAYLTYMQSTSRKMLDWMKHKLDSRCRRKYQ